MLSVINRTINNISSSILECIKLVNLNIIMLILKNNNDNI